MAVKPQLHGGRSRPWLESLCPPRGLVLDPFVGSGTVAKVAHELGRSCIGFDLNPAYLEHARARVQPEQMEVSPL